MSERDVAIRVAGAGKRYVRFEDTPMLVTSALRFRNRSTKSYLWALRNLDLEFERGACIGVIGRNGSGKSTLLQLLAGVTTPTEGVVTVRGHVAPLISVGVGFHPELTGRENVFVNGTILGMTRKQVEHDMESIIDFAEIEGFVDTPVKFYSSGMAVRLGFAVAVHSTPEILLVDEVLAVGDLAFQLKSFDRMNTILRSGATIALVSHNLNAIRNLADRTVVLDRGNKVFEGDTGDAISLFHKLMGEERELDDVLDRDEQAAFAEGAPVAARIVSATLRREAGEVTANVRTGEVVTARAEIVFDRAVNQAILGFGIRNERHVVAYSDSNHRAGGLGPRRAGERVEVDVTFTMQLVTGSYDFSFRLVDGDLKTPLAASERTNFFVSGHGAHGVADLAADFAVAAPTDA